MFHNFTHDTSTPANKKINSKCDNINGVSIGINRTTNETIKNFSTSGCKLGFKNAANKNPFENPRVVIFKAMRRSRRKLCAGHKKTYWSLIKFPWWMDSRSPFPSRALRQRSPYLSLLKAAFHSERLWGTDYAIYMFWDLLVTGLICKWYPIEIK